MSVLPVLPEGITLFERGWLSSNNILIQSSEEAVLVDSGYVSHANQTIALVAQALGAKPLNRLINTHGHSDHIGGNAALQAYFACEIHVPESLHPTLHDWDESALLLNSTGQSATPFRPDATIAPGTLIAMGDYQWETLAVPGHENHALAYFSRDHGVLIPGDALWENGFGVVFSELMGDPEGLLKVRHTLDSLARLPLRTVLPGHGPAFANIEEAFERAYARLAAFEQFPEKMAWNGIKALVVFYLLEQRRIETKALGPLISQLSLLADISHHYLRLEPEAVAQRLIADLLKAGALKEEEGWLLI